MATMAKQQRVFVQPGVIVEDGKVRPAGPVVCGNCERDVETFEARDLGGYVCHHCRIFTVCRLGRESAAELDFLLCGGCQFTSDPGTQYQVATLA